MIEGTLEVNPVILEAKVHERRVCCLRILFEKIKLSYY